MVKLPVFCDPSYYVDDSGVVYSKYGRPLKPSINHSGYQIVNLLINGKRVGIAVHTIVARTFIPGYRPGLQVNHKDGNKTNNAVTNLEWITRLENIRHARIILGFDKRGSKNPRARAVIAYNEEETYYFPAIIDAGRFFSNGDEKRARHIQNSICRVLKKNDGNAYRNYTWKYGDMVE